MKAKIIDSNYVRSLENITLNYPREIAFERKFIRLHGEKMKKELDNKQTRLAEARRELADINTRRANGTIKLKNMLHWSNTRILITGPYSTINNPYYMSEYIPCVAVKAIIDGDEKEIHEIKHIRAENGIQYIPDFAKIDKISFALSKKYNIDIQNNLKTK